MSNYIFSIRHTLCQFYIETRFQRYLFDDVPSYIYALDGYKIADQKNKVVS